MKRSISLLKAAGRLCVRQNDKKEAANTTVIAILGLDRGVGTTHMSVMIGNYLANGRGMRVALVEYNSHNDFSRIRKETDKSFETMNCFTYCTMDFYRNVDSAKIASVIAKNYDIVILDMEYTYSNCFDEFMRSDIRIAVGGMDMWRIGRLKGFLQEAHNLQSNSYHCVTVSYIKKKAQALEREFAVKLLAVPFERDPFLISAESLLWLKSITV